MSVQKSQFKDKTLVTVKPLAYYKMLVHILRFGNKARDRRQFKEVMGILIGRLEGEGEIKNVIVEDAVPISHGGSIEVAFKPEDYVSFSYVDAEYAVQDPPLFSVGWYHSHPALRIFFSATDIKNQLGWQVPNPSAIGIVFDHTYLEQEGDLGFRTFRLSNPEKGPMSEYHEVKTVVEPPDDVSYYVKIMNIINSIHSKEPPILEINETPDLFGDITMPGQSQIMSKQPELELEKLMGAFQEGISQLITASLQPLIQFLNTWSQDMVKNIIEDNLEFRKNVIELRDNVSSGISEIQSTFKSGLTNKMYDLDAYFDDLLEGFDGDQEKIKNALSSIKEEIKEGVNTIFEEKLKATIDGLLNSIEGGKEKINAFKEKSGNIAQNLETQQKTLGEMPNTIKSTKEAVLNKLKEAQDNALKKVTQNTSNAIEDITDIRKKIKELSTDLDTAISLLMDSKSSLQEKLKKPTQEGGAS